MAGWRLIAAPLIDTDKDDLVAGEKPGSIDPEPRVLGEEGPLVFAEEVGPSGVDQGGVSALQGHALEVEGLLNLLRRDDGAAEDILHSVNLALFCLTVHGHQVDHDSAGDNGRDQVGAELLELLMLKGRIQGQEFWFPVADVALAVGEIGPVLDRKRLDVVQGIDAVVEEIVLPVVREAVDVGANAREAGQEVVIEAALPVGTLGLRVLDLADALPAEKGAWRSRREEREA